MLNFTSILATIHYIKVEAKDAKIINNSSKDDAEPRADKVETEDDFTESEEEDPEDGKFWRKCCKTLKMIKDASFKNFLTLILNVALMINAPLKVYHLSSMTDFLMETDLTASFIDFSSYMNWTDALLSFDVFIYFMMINVLTTVLF